MRRCCSEARVGDAAREKSGRRLTGIEAFGGRKVGRRARVDPKFGCSPVNLRQLWLNVLSYPESLYSLQDQITIELARARRIAAESVSIPPFVTPQSFHNRRPGGPSWESHTTLFLSLVVCPAQGPQWGGSTGLYGRGQSSTVLTDARRRNGRLGRRTGSGSSRCVVVTQLCDQIPHLSRCLSHSRSPLKSRQRRSEGGAAATFPLAARLSRITG